MAWLQNLADRAEDLLNKVDQTAATVLSETKQEIPEEYLEPGPSSQYETYYDPTTTTALKLTNSQSQNVNELLPSISKQNEDIEITEKSFPSSLHRRTAEKLEDSNPDVIEKPFKYDSSFKSSSSQNSYYQYEESPILIEKNKLEEENNELNKQMLNLQHLCSELKNENSDLKIQVESSKNLAISAHSEMEQYKIRAHRILQEKEKLIQLKGLTTTSEDANNTILSNYNQELKRELEFQQAKNKELTENYEALTSEVTFLRKQVVILQTSLQQAQQNFEQTLSAEKKMRLIAEEECQIKSQELLMKTQELFQQQNLVTLKDNEIKHLKEHIRQSANISANNDYESRIKSLTDALLLKQNKLEAITSERNTLKIQLEKLENEYHNNLAQLQRAQVRIINVNDTDDVKSQVPQFMRVSPLDAGVTRRVKHAYSTVDAISIRTGIFLRRYPVARVFVFCYMVLLQLWALFVLFLYAPSNR